MVVGIEAMNIFGGMAYLDVKELADFRKLNQNRFHNLLMKEKTVALPCEDPVTYGVNAAKPIIDTLSESEKNKIELLITCSESGIDFGKSMSTYIHDYLGLNKNCRLFEIKQACYSGTAGLQMAINFILSNTSKNAKALVIATDISRFLVTEGGEALTEDWSYAEPSAGAGAVAVLISNKPYIYQVDIGANGYYGCEIMDTCRPIADSESGNADLSLLSYLDCCEQTFKEYQKRVANVNYKDTFQYLCYHTPFGGMVKGAHRTMMRKLVGCKGDEIEKDFLDRVLPGLDLCQRTGNIMGGTVLLAIASTIINGEFKTPKRLGCFSYGSGCCSEFYSGIVTKEGQEELNKFEIKKHLNNRYRLSIQEYGEIIKESNKVKFGTRNITMDLDALNNLKENQQLVLKRIKEYHREYAWL